VHSVSPAREIAAPEHSTRPGYALASIALKLVDHSVPVVDRGDHDPEEVTEDLGRFRTTRTRRSCGRSVRVRRSRASSIGVFSSMIQFLDRMISSSAIATWMSASAPRFNGITNAAVSSHGANVMSVCRRRDFSAVCRISGEQAAGPHILEGISRWPEVAWLP
jgi:hypothetical protein